MNTYISLYIYIPWNVFKFRFLCMLLVSHQIYTGWTTPTKYHITYIQIRVPKFVELVWNLNDNSLFPYYEHINFTEANILVGLIFFLCKRVPGALLRHSSKKIPQKKCSSMSLAQAKKSYVIPTSYVCPCQIDRKKNWW